MTPEIKDQIVEVLITLNRRHGWGDVYRVNFSTNKVSILWPVSHHGRVKDTRRFRFDGHTVYFLRHQITIVKRKKNHAANTPNRSTR